MKNIAKCAVGLLVAALAVNAAQASVIVNVDILHTESVYSGVGVIGTGTFWNSTQYSGTNLKADDGSTTTAISYSVTGTNRGLGAAAATISLFGDYIHNGGGEPNYLAISGLDNSLTYNLILYGAQAAGLNRGATFTVNSVSKSTTGDQQSSFADGVNYVRYDDLAPASNSLNVTISNGPDGIAIFNGFQLQVIPEPASLGLLGVAGLAMLWRRRLKG